MGKKPVAILEGVNVALADNMLTAKGPKGELSMKVTGDVTVQVNDGEVVVASANDSKRAKAMWGTTRSNVNNLIIGAKVSGSREDVAFVSRIFA
jgi:large subunit ribosomal protein L6